MTLAILTACAVALFAWAARSFFRARPGLTPRERAWAKMLGVPDAKTRAELQSTLRPKLHVGMDLSTEDDRTVHALTRISPEGARQHVHVFEDADWSEGVDALANMRRALRELEGVEPVPREVEVTPEEWRALAERHGVASAAASPLGVYPGVPVRIVSPPAELYPHDEVTEVVRITDPVKR